MKAGTTTLRCGVVVASSILSLLYWATTKHFNKFKKALNDAKRLIRQLDGEREAAKKKPN